MTPPMETGKAPMKAEKSAPSQSALQQLQAIEADSKKKVPKQFLGGFNKLMAAGKNAMFSDATYKGATQNYLDAITDLATVPDKVSHGVMKLMTVLANEADKKGGVFPLEPAGLAAQMFMCDGLEYLIEVRKMPIDQAVIDQTTKLVKDGMLFFIKDFSTKKYGLSEEDVNRGMTGQHDFAKQGKEPAPKPEAAPVEEEEEDV